MLPHAVASRSSDRWSHIWSEASDGFARSRSPSSISWRVPAMRSSRVMPVHPRPGSSPRDPLARGGSMARARRPRSAPPAKRVTGRIPATLEHRNASSAAARSAGVRRASTGRSPTRGPQPSSQDRVVPGRIAQSSDGVASSGRPSPVERRTRKMLAVVPSDRWSSTVRKSASSAPARRASSRAKT